MFAKKQKVPSHKQAVFTALVGITGIAVLWVTAQNTAMAMQVTGTSPGYYMEGKEMPEEGTSENFKVTEVEPQTNFPTIGASSSYSLCGELAGQNMGNCELPPPQEEEDNGEPEPQPEEENQQQQNGGDSANSGSSGSGGSGSPSTLTTTTQPQPSTSPSPFTTAPSPSATQAPISPAQPLTPPPATAPSTPSHPALPNQRAASTDPLASPNILLNIPPERNKTAYGPWPESRNEIAVVGSQSSSPALHQSAPVNPIFSGEFYSKELIYGEDTCSTLAADRERTPWEKQKISSMLALTIIFNGGIAIYVLHLILEIRRPRISSRAKKR